MGCRRLRRPPVLSPAPLAPRRRALAVAAAIAVLLAVSPARAGRNDLHLMNLCDTSGGTGCVWLTQSATGTTVNLDADPQAKSRFRSLMSELGVVIAPALQTPADTLGFAGLQFSVELATTQISHDQSFWNGVQGVDPSNPAAHRPDAWLTTLGGFVRKGLWFPFLGLELGAGGVNVLQSGMWALQGYLKLAILEGFHAGPVPSLAVRAGTSRLVGTDQVTLAVSSLDVLISKAFSLAGTARLEPFAGWDFLFIDAHSGVIQAPAACTTATTPSAACQPAPGVTFTFPRQDLITRNRVYAGGKIRLGKLFLVAQVARAFAGRSQDGRVAVNPARDDSAGQSTVSLSAGFDF
jgi:hypothetical protein